MQCGVYDYGVVLLHVTCINNIYNMQDILMGCSERFGQSQLVQRTVFDVLNRGTRATQGALVGKGDLENRCVICTYINIHACNHADIQTSIYIIVAFIFLYVYHTVSPGCCI